MGKNFFCLIVVFCFLFVPRVAQAQRLVPGQWDLSLGVAGWSQYGLSLDFDKVDYNHKMLCRLSGLTVREAYDVASHDNQDDPAMYNVRVLDFLASWGMVWRVAGNRSRSVNLWLGAAGDAGVRMRSPLSVLDRFSSYGLSDLYDMETVDGLSDDRIPSASFLLGVSPELCFEWFPAHSFSLSAFVRPRLQWCAVGSSYSGNGREAAFLPVAGLSFSWYIFVGR